MFVSILRAMSIAASLSVDAFTAGVAYGSKKIHISMKCVQIINIVCCFIMGLSLFAGHLLRPVLPEAAVGIIAFTVLFSIGLVKLLDSIIKAIIRRHTVIDKAMGFSLFDIKFMLRLYANPHEADKDTSEHISAAEAVAVAVSLSLDGMAVGFAAALAGVNPWVLILASLITNTLAIILGRKLGFGLAKKLPFNITWLAGVVLMILGVSHLF